MSRVGKKPIAIPSGVTVTQRGAEVHVKGPKGSLSQRIPKQISVEIEGERVSFTRPDDRKESRALHGLTRSLVANMVQGVSQPFVKELEIQGVGYRADMKGKTLKMLLGFSHPVEVEVPEGLTVSIDRNVIVRIEGVDRQKVGQFAADIRAIRPPEPYKGKGIRYLDERVRRKVGKAGVTV
jgi:large subunit ribosomal protein L6